MKIKHLRRTLASVVVAAAFGAPAHVLAQIKVGQTAGFTGAVSAGVTETALGAQIYLDAINAKGGVHGQKVEVVALDDKFDPKLTAENGKKLIADADVVALFLNRGTPHTEALMPLIEQAKIALVAPSTGAMVLHEPFNRYIFNVRATYQAEAEKAVLHLGNLGMSNIAIVQVDDSFGKDGAAGALKGFEKLKAKPVLHATYDRAKPDFSAIVPKIVQAAPHAVIFIGSGSAVTEGVKAIRAAGSHTQFVTLSNNASGGFIKQLGDHARGMIVTQVYPFEGARSTPMVNEAFEMGKAKGVSELTPAMLEGFAAATVLVEGLKRAGPKPTRESVIKGLESMQSFDLGGHVVTYGPRDHSGLSYSDLAIVSREGKFKR